MALAANEVREFIGYQHALDTILAAANQVFWKGSAILVGTDGYAYVATAVAGRRSAGVAAGAVDTTGKASGDLSVAVNPGTVGWFSSAGGDDLVQEDDKFKTVYWVDDDTIALTDGAGTRSAAGTVFDVDADGKIAIMFKEYIL